MQVYLQKSVPENERIRIQKTIAAESFVYTEGDGVEFISKEDAAEQFIKETGEDFTEFLGDNPLRDAFNISIAPDYQHVDSLRKVKTKLATIEGIYEVSYVEDLINSINNNMAKIGIFLLSFAIILILAIVILINNTIKLALFSQRFLVRSMQLVGAKTSFIINPFLTRSLVHGMLAGILASLIIGGFIFYISSRIVDVKSLLDGTHIMILFASLIGMGIILATLSTYRAVGKYLKMSLDELF